MLSIKGIVGLVGIVSSRVLSMIKNSENIRKILRYYIRLIKDFGQYGHFISEFGSEDCAVNRISEYMEYYPDDTIAESQRYWPEDFYFSKIAWLNSVMAVLVTMDMCTERKDINASEAYHVLKEWRRMVPSEMMLSDEFNNTFAAEMAEAELRKRISRCRSKRLSEICMEYANEFSNFRKDNCL